MISSANKTLISICASFLAIFFYFHNIPFSKLPSNYDVIISLFRIFYYLLFAFFIFKLKRLSRLIYENNIKEFYLISNTLIIFSLIIALGLFSKFFIIIHHLLFLFLFRKNKSRFYGIEQIYLQIIGLFFIFSNSNSFLSLDVYFKNYFFLSDTHSVYSLNFLIISFSLCLFSGFYEKLNSSMWVSGSALKYFFHAPHVKRHKIKNNIFNNSVLKILTYTTLISQALLLFFLNLDIGRIIFLLSELIFSILLITIFPFHFIGETFILVMTFLLSVDFSIFHFEDEALLKEISYEKFFLGFIIFISLIGIFIDKKKMPNFIQYINRYLSGMFPFKVFTEKHIFSIKIFKINAYKNSQLVKDNIFKIFDKNKVGQDQLFLPRVIHSFLYRLSDVIERRSLKKFREEDTKLLKNFMITSLDYCKDYKIDKLIFFVKEFNPKRNYSSNVLNLNNSIEKKWNAICVYYSKKNKFIWKKIKKKKRKYVRIIN